MNLRIELVPRSSWGNNVRSMITAMEWDIVRHECYRRAGYECEICGGKGKKHPVECHEIWKYNKKTHIQKLVGLIALCPNCHTVKHLGRAEAVGILWLVVKHLKKINNWSEEKVYNYIDEVKADYIKKSKVNWTVDLGNLNKIIKKIRKENEKSAW